MTNYLLHFIQRIGYGFGFGLGMSFAWKINPIDTPQRWNFNQPEFKNDQFNNDKFNNDK